MSKVVVIGCSSGGLAPLVDLLSELPATYPHPIIVASHSGPESHLLPALKLKSKIQIAIKKAEDGEELVGQTVYVLPGATHGLVTGNTLRLSELVRESGFRPSIDALFMTAAAEYQENTIGVVLSGTMSDGMRGAQVIYDMGGVTIVQDPDEAKQASMPQSVIKADHPQEVLEASALGQWLVKAQ
ncbi:chemotaxis protein CheB [Yoonia sp. 208BN28-4]|uniref:chemotaxis protein CheB n=1 Tax=Yoonia sp. 208BN28-4 TaxID=3126505 RepID=UPI0030A51B2E